MLPLRALRRLPLPPRCIQRCSRPVSRPSSTAAQLLHDPSPTYHHHHAAPPPPPPHLPLNLPSPLPNDIVSPPSSAHSALYPSTSVLDSISMISICLRRPEHVPRAYQIFTQLLRDPVTGQSRAPEAKVWSVVIEGVASLAGQQGSSAGAERWRKRAEKLVEQWGVSFGSKGKVPVLEHQGIKVYQGWFNGLLSSQSPIDPMVPYLRSPALSAISLLDGLEASVLPLACQALIETADRAGLPALKEEVLIIQGEEKQRREAVASEVIADVAPVLEGSGKSTAPQRQQSERREARFAIANLRQALSAIESTSIPVNRQRELEAASYQAARSELEENAKRFRSGGDDSTLQRSKLQSWMYTWLGQLTAELESRITAMQAQVASLPPSQIEPATLKYSATARMKPQVLFMYLSLLPADKLALITILEIMRMSGSGGIVDGMKVLRGMVAVGKAVETEFRAETIKNVAGVDSHHWLKSIDPQTQKPSRQLIGSVWKKIGEQVKQPKISEQAEGGSLQEVWTPSWSRMVQLGVGSELVDALLKVAKVEREAKDRHTGTILKEEQSAFTHSYEYVRGKKLGVIKLNPEVAARLARDDIGVVIHPKHLPMLVEPRRWTSHNEGGYLLHSVPVMRYKESLEQQKWLQAASEEGHLEPIFHGLDVLSSTSWRINRQVFDVVLASWNQGEAIADIPASEDRVNYDFPEPLDPSNQDPQVRTKYVEKMKMVLAQQRKDHAERCKFNYNIEIARSYLKDEFFLPHNMDFRGRAYPIPPHLSPVGDDLCRGLLTFGTRKPLGTTGLRWLQIHLANVYGYDKASFEERAQFAQAHHADIFDSADNPLGGNRWWLNAEDPWQCLATCFELTSALRSPHPEAFESSLPVHQDGTCNGMQHYAALGGDVQGAKAVNLEAGDRPADIYTGVVDIVNRVIEEDKKSGHAVACLIDEALGRKVVKQTVMTTVYGVTFVGARDQIAKQLQARGDVSQDDIFAVSSYIAKTVLNCIGDLFSGAKSIMDWLATAARLISRSIPYERASDAASQLTTTSRSGKVVSRASKEFMSAVIWTTPLGLPVVQPYRKAQKKQIMTALQSVYISDPNAPAEVSPQKQATAFPPNFIHSLDATHMLLTALKCKQNNIAFASVHDSYWTHAATVEPMSELIRGTFVELHSQDLVGKLRQEFLSRYGDYCIPVQSAQNISTSSTKRRVAAAKRQRAMSEMLPPSEMSDATDVGLSAESAFRNDIAEAEVDLITSSNEVTEAKAAESMGLSAGKLDEIAGLAVSGQEIPTMKMGGQAWVRFKDVLPPCPPRGIFQVQKVKESAYFFS
ncbi:DNA-directed RNA polymerase, mitochondrial [Cryptococcus wingfieldii CBS 7118]|uniref:DNA-directed RNA polymerase n=1 Tax=Cryptococcus wingfieldii CBS 7118 TaxID=1295528 RepID=A0A1E3J6F2_9TREE|nr:DNA-directed RNA polymerase, mitochondrial [Cryptococcus wingfieldii CBS 7118]ODN96443.1 DNA-directed RNA polymerase, mitochondrial [Cryptococcus wingfieldii CBS 7118]